MFKEMYNLKKYLKEIFLLNITLKLLIKIFFIIKEIFIFLLNFFISILLYRSIRLYICNHLNIGIWNLFQKKTIFPHPIGIVIGFNVKLGMYCTIYQNVTIGTKDTRNFRNAKYPRIGDNVTIYPNSVIIGDIEVGDNSIIGAGTILLKSVPPNSIVYGNPGKIKSI